MGSDTPEPKRQKTGSDGEGSARGNVVTPSSVKDDQNHKDYEGAPAMRHSNPISNLMPPKSDEPVDGGRSYRAPSSEGEEEADNHTMTRMMVDSTGRLCKSSRLNFAASLFCSGFNFVRFVKRSCAEII